MFFQKCLWGNNKLIYESVCRMANDTVFGPACLKVLNKFWLWRQGHIGSFVGFLLSSLICRICAYIKVVGDSLRCLLPCGVYVCIACVVEGIVVYVVVVCVLWAMWCVRLLCVCMVRTVRGICCVCGICNVVMAVCLVCGGGCMCVWFDKLRHQPWACLQHQGAGTRWKVLYESAMWALLLWAVCLCTREAPCPRPPHTTLQTSWAKNHTFPEMGRDLQLTRDRWPVMEQKLLFHMCPEEAAFPEGGTQEATKAGKLNRIRAHFPGGEAWNQGHQWRDDRPLFSSERLLLLLSHYGAVWRLSPCQLS